MEELEWVNRCAGRLQQQWPHAPADEVREAAADLAQQEGWRRFAPEVAAVAWLRLGVLAS